MDNISEARLKEVSPALAARIRKMYEMLNVEGITIRVTQGLRSWSMQNELWQQGRDEHGNVVDKRKVVTQARPGHSWHEFGLACDVVPLDKDGAPIWNRDSDYGKRIWDRIVAVGESCGLFSGSRFVHAPADYPHFQLTGKFPASPNGEARQTFIDAGMTSVWKQAVIAS